MKNFKAIALLIALIAISNISAALKPKEQKEYNALLATIKNNKPLNSAQSCSQI